MREQLTFKRQEAKYMITRPEFNRIKELMLEYMIADEHGKSTILSLYFDTPDYRLIRKSLEHPIYKEKLRLRSYGTADETSQVFIELKKKYDSIVYKRRIAMTKREADDYLLGGSHEFHNESYADRQISGEIDYFFKLYRELHPAILLSYDREAFYARDNHEFRVTFDDNILWRDYNLTVDSGVYGSSLLPPDKVLMEIKTADAIPLWLVRFLNDNRIYRSSFSKYGAAYSIICQNKLNGGNYRYA